MSTDVDAIMRELLDAARDGLLALDESGTIVEANDATAQLLHRQRRDIVGKPLAALVPIDQRPLCQRHLELALEGRRTTVDLELGADRVPSTVSMWPVPGTNPTRIAVSAGRAERERGPHTQPSFFSRLPHAVVGVSRDGTVAFSNLRAHVLLGVDAVRPGRPVRQAKIPIDLPQLADNALTGPYFSQDAVELQDGRALRVTGIPPQRDEPAVLILEDVTAQHRHDRVMREFVRNAAHQLRTPLTGITTAVDVLQGGAKNVPADRDRFLEHIQRHAARLTRIARGLLVLARAQSGEQLPELEFVELRPLLESLAADAVPAPGVTVETSCPASLVALAEPSLMHEALAALVDNAISHTREGSVRLVAHEMDGHVEIDVVDDGPGIPFEHRERIFEPFYRAFDAGDGFGLGLAIASQAAAAMDGELRAVATPSGGTRFSIRLPAAEISR